MTDTELSTAIGKAIRQTRRRRGWTQAELAERCGVRQKDISTLEHGRRVPMLPALVVVFMGLGFDVVRLVAGKRGTRPLVVRLT